MQVACLGVTEGDWRILGQSAMECLDFEIAALAISRLGDKHMLQAAHQLSQQCTAGLSRLLAHAAALAILVSAGSIPCTLLSG
jgi:hypothetical protein